MQTFSTFSERTIKYNYKPNTPRFLPEERKPDHEIILFSVTAESILHISESCIKIIDSKHAHPSDDFFKVVDLPEGERPLFLKSLYRAPQSTAIFPFGRKILAIYNPLLRSNALGIAFIFKHSPSSVSALIDTDNQSLIKDILFSPSFDEIPKRRGNAIAFANSLMRTISALNDHLSKNTASADSAINIMTHAADLIDIPVTFEIDLDDICNRPFDTRSILAFSLSLLSIADRISAEHSAEVKISGGKRRSISVDFDLQGKADIKKELRPASFCERLASELRVPFLIDIKNGHFHAEFVPFREDPSLFGLKTGIFIDQKPLIRT